MSAMVRIPMPRLSRVEPLEKHRVRVTWGIGSRANTTEDVDLSPLIGTLKFYRPLRDNAELFRSVHLTNEGSAIAWGDKDDIDMAASSIERLAQETMTGDDLRKFLQRHRLTHSAAAAALGYGKRRIESFLSGAPIPRVVVLACFGFEARVYDSGSVPRVLELINNQPEESARKRIAYDVVAA